MLAFKDQGVKGNVDGVAFLLKKNKIDTVHGTATIAAPGKVEVRLAAGGAQTLETKSIVIATGSDVARLPGIDIDEETIVSSTGALSLPQVPKRMLVIGAGVIGLELGSVWRRLGSRGAGGGVPRPRAAGHRRRGGAHRAAHPRQAGHDLQAVEQGDGRQQERRAAIA